MSSLLAVDTKQCDLIKRLLPPSQVFACLPAHSGCQLPTLRLCGSGPVKVDAGGHSRGGWLSCRVDVERLPLCLLTLVAASLASFSPQILALWDMSCTRAVSKWCHRRRDSPPPPPPRIYAFGIVLTSVV